jgi:hypothetical protein
MNANSCNAITTATISLTGRHTRRDPAPPVDEETVTMLEKKTLIAAFMATTFLTAGAAFAADQAMKPGGSQTAVDKDVTKLSADAARAYNDLSMTRLAIYDGRVADAKKLVDAADTAFDKAKTDDSVFLKAEADLKMPGAASSEPQKTADATTPKRWLPIDADMSVDEDFTANPAKAAAVADANKSLAKGDRAGAQEKLKLADVGVTYVMAVVPLDQTFSDVHKAAQLIDGGKYYEGSQMLRQVQDSTRYDVVAATGVPGKVAPQQADATDAKDAGAKAATH